MNADPAPMNADKTMRLVRARLQIGSSQPSSAFIGVGSAFIGVSKAFCPHRSAALK